MSLAFYVSNDGRIITQTYLKGDKTRFCLAEKTSKGTLITEFNERSEVVNQVYKKNGGMNLESDLSGYLNVDEKKVVLTGNYKGIMVRAKCRSCGNVGLKRSLDLTKPSEITEVPVVPLFVCGSCGSPHYSLTDDYLKALVEGRSELFEKEELEEIRGDTIGAVKLLQEYIIRIFASKKISRIRIE
jgi:hypothetical protein